MSEVKLPKLPDWTKRDDLGCLVPSEVRTAMCEFARAAVLADRVARVQLTDSQVDEILDAPGTINFVIADKRERWRLFARLIERAHGIK